MPADRDQAYILDLSKAGSLICQFTQDMDAKTFDGDLKTQSAVIHQLLILGEATKCLSEEFRAKHPDIPWQQIARMRDKLIHHYRGVNVHEVWRAAMRDVPLLVSRLQPLLPHEP